MFALICFAKAAPAEAETLGRDIFIIGGQSNAVGYGIAPSLFYPYQSKVHNYANSGEWLPASDPIDNGTNQVDMVSHDAAPGRSFAIAFGSKLYELRPSYEVGVVPCAKSGRSLADYAPNLSRSTMYGSMVARALEAAEAGTLRGLIWYQGENEAGEGTSTNANNWASTFLNIYDNLCTDLGMPDLKCIVTELHDLATPNNRPWWANVQAQQRSLDGARGGNIVCVSAADLPGQAGNQIHLGPPQLKILGERYAAAMATLIGS